MFLSLLGEYYQEKLSPDLLDLSGCFAMILMLSSRIKNHTKITPMSATKEWMYEVEKQKEAAFDDSHYPSEPQLVGQIEMCDDCMKLFEVAYGFTPETKAGVTRNLCQICYSKL